MNRRTFLAAAVAAPVAAMAAATVEKPKRWSLGSRYVGHFHTTTPQRWPNRISGCYIFIDKDGKVRPSPDIQRSMGKSTNPPDDDGNVPIVFTYQRP